MYKVFWVCFDFPIVRKWKALKLVIREIHEAFSILRIWKRKSRMTSPPLWGLFTTMGWEKVWNILYSTSKKFANFYFVTLLNVSTCKKVGGAGKCFYPNILGDRAQDLSLKIDSWTDIQYSAPLTSAFSWWNLPKGVFFDPPLWCLIWMNAWKGSLLSFTKWRWGLHSRQMDLGPQSGMHLTSHLLLEFNVLLGLVCHFASSFQGIRNMVWCSVFLFFFLWGYTVPLFLDPVGKTSFLGFKNLFKTITQKWTGNTEREMSSWQIVILFQNEQFTSTLIYLAGKYLL